MTARRPPHWPALDGLRGVASLMVMICHFVPSSPPFQSAFGRRLSAVGHIGWIGVDLFFALSGFLITSILVRAKGSESYLVNFYARRALRIGPLYYLVLLGAFVVVPLVAPHQLVAMRDTLDHQGWLWTYSYNLRMLGTGHFWADGGVRLSHFWTLSVEEHFYLIWPLLVLWTDRRTLLRVAVSVVLLVPVLRTVSVLVGVSHAIIYSFTLFRVDSLMMGAIVALAGSSELRVSMRRLAPPTWIACAVCFGFLVWLSHDPSGLKGPMAAVGYTVLSLSSAAIIVLATGSEATFLTRALRSKVLRWFGRYSYGAYVLHLILQPAIDRWASSRRMEHVLGSDVLALVAHVGVGIGVTMLAAVTTFHLYERPFLGLKRLFEHGEPIAPALRWPLPDATERAPVRLSSRLT